MTKSGYAKLKQDLEEYETVKLEEAKQRINNARKFCDFNEDSEYEMALKELESIQKRISTIHFMIQQAEIIQKTEMSIVEIGHTVSLKETDSDEIETYTIVGTEEADPLQEKISYNSPVAQSILGAKTKDVVTLKAPGGDRQVEILSIS